MSESDADRIRNKRLAKLGGMGSTNSTDNPSRAASQQSLSSETINTKANGSQTEGDPDTNPFTKLGIKAQDAPARTPAINIRPNSATAVNRDPKSISGSKARQETAADWEDKTLSSLFRISLHKDKTTDRSGNPLYFIGGVRADLEQENVPLKLTTNLLDQALIEAASNQGKTPPLDYLLACWKRITKLSRTAKASGQDTSKSDVIKEAKRICFNYCMFAVTVPDIFGLETPAINNLTQHLLVDPESDRGICHDFLTEAISRFEDDESVKNAFVEAIEHLSVSLSSMSMNDNYRPYVSALSMLVRYAPLVIALAESSKFIPATLLAQDIEKQTLLGPFFQLSPLQGEVALNYFSSPKTRDRGYIHNSQNALRMTLQQHQEELFIIADRFVKASKESRDRMLDWFATTVNTNHRRRAMRTDERYISSDGFMINVTVCLDRLCEPFMDATFSKINRIEVEYLRRSPRVKIDDETKINADQSTSDRFYAEKKGGSSNFISEIFFLTVAAHHYGTEAANSKLTELRRSLKHMDKEIEKIEAERDKYSNRGPAVLALFDQRLKEYKNRAERGHCVVLATEGVLIDEQAQARAMSFMRYVIVWLMRLVSGLDYPRQTFNLPLPSDQPEVFKCLPEYFIEDIVDHFKFITSHMPHIVLPTQCDEIVMVCITFLENTEYIKNPYLKSGLVSILFHGVIPVRSSTNGVLGSILNSMPFAMKYLLHALMNFYIDCEFTGGHGVFYDKFNIRYEIFQVIKCVWGNVVYREQLATEAKVNLDFFVRFVNLLLNDVTFVLDESFTAFQQITSITKELKDQSMTMDETTKTEKEEAREAAQGKAKSYMQLTNETLAMLKLFTDALAETFTMPEIVQRLADMLDYNLDTLVGPKQNSINVENPMQYNFQPAVLLSDIVDVYLNLGAQASFQLAVAKDGRSYKPENFKQAAIVLLRYGKKSADELKRWNKLCELIADAKRNDEAEEEDLGDIPDEFLDPLLATLMTDPVILPTSKNTIDRSTIRQMLLSDRTDPFNRAPLKIEDVIPNTELKAQIDAFRAERRGRKVAAMSENAMDLTNP